LLINCAVDFVEICNVYVKKMVIKAPKRIFNSDTICRSHSDLNFGVTFLEHSVVAATGFLLNNKAQFKMFTHLQRLLFENEDVWGTRGL